MIFVTLGTQNNSFHRLLEEIQKCIDNKIINEEVIVQAGATKFESSSMKIFKLISMEEMNNYIKEANYIITHGGVGSIIAGLKNKKKVIAVPRYQKYGEHVNDHQTQIIKNFDEKGFIKGIAEVSELENAIREIHNFTPKEFISNNEKILKLISNFIDNDKKLLFTAYSLDVGGIETALVTLVNQLQKMGYHVTIALEKKEGIFLKELNPKIKIIEYSPSNNKNKLIRKIINLLKRIKFILKYKNRYDFSASFATYSIAGSFMARTGSKNSCLWGHADYLTLFNNSEEEVKKFFTDRKYNSFKNIIFVSNEGKKSFIKVFPEMKEKVITCNNLIDGDRIIKLSKEKIEISKENNCVTFLNVGRHDEKQKRLSRLIEASKKLKDDGYNFKILFVGDGPDKEKYVQMVNQYQLNKNIIFLGKKQNPYPYFNISDCVVLTSDYEGYPVVFLESYILNKPIITTNVSDCEQIEGKYGFVATKDTNDIYNKMKQFIENGFEIKDKFNYEKYNSEIIQKIKGENGLL